MDYLPHQHNRQRAATHALLVAKRDVLSTMRPSDRAIPGIYAHRILETDDRFGREENLVVQGDGIGWAMIDAVFRLAERATEAHYRDDHRGHDPKCDICALIYSSVRSTQLATPITERRTSSEVVVLSERRR